MKHSIINGKITRRRFIFSGLLTAAGIGLGIKTPILAATELDSSLVFNLNFEIKQPEGGFRYNRPYVAVWLEDANGNPVRTLALWFQVGRGSRWLPDLKRWYSKEQGRKSKQSGDLSTTISGPTRNPGKYSLAWDGKDDNKKQLNIGEYVLCIESAREHGPYFLIQEKINLSLASINKTIPGNEEITNLSLEYKAKK